MHISIRNFGPIKEGELEFTDKTVVVGGNASGKTFLSTLIYFLATPKPMPPVPLKLDLPPGQAGQTVVAERVLRMGEVLNENKEQVLSMLRTYIGQVFGLEPPQLVSFDAEEAVVDADKFSLRITRSGIDVATKIDEIPITIRLSRIDSQFCFAASTMQQGKLHFDAVGRDECVGPQIAALALQTALSYPEYNPVAFISTERIALLNFADVAKLAFAPLLQRFAKPLILDFAKFLTPGLHRGPIEGLEYEVGDGGALKVRWRGRELALAATATGFYQLAPVAIIADNSAVRTMIIEEPEINLHADAQIEVAKYLAGVGKKLFITTHSEWIAMYMAKMSRAKVYEIVDGKVEERKVDEDGHLELLRTIHPHTIKALERDLLA